MVYQIYFSALGKPYASFGHIFLQITCLSGNQYCQKTVYKSSNPDLQSYNTINFTCRQKLTSSYSLVYNVELNGKLTGKNELKIN